MKENDNSCFTPFMSIIRGQTVARVHKIMSQTENPKNLKVSIHQKLTNKCDPADPKVQNNPQKRLNKREQSDFV